MTSEVRHLKEFAERHEAAGSAGGRKRPDEVPLRPGLRVGGLRLVERLGQGGHGSVFLARRGGRQYAVKFICLERVGEWGWRELEVMLRLRRLGLLRVEGHGRWPDKAPRFLYLVMEYVHGLPLDEYARRHRLTARRVAGVVRELARQVGAMHSVGVVHRDIKEANVVVREADGLPVLVDFGVGTWPGALRVTQVGSMPGTALYRSPEALHFWRESVFSREARYPPVRPLDDLWALGVVLYWLLTGRHPFSGRDTLELGTAILHFAPEAPHVLNPRVPRALSELCLRLLDKAPQARFADAEALGAALEEVLAGADDTWDVPLREEEPPSEKPRAPGAWSGLVLALPLVGLLASLGADLTPRVSAVESTREVRFPVQEVAPPREPPEGDEGAAPPRAATPAPVASATLPKDDTRVNRKQQEQTSRQEPASVLDALGKGAGLLVTCAALTGCPPAPQVRPTPPPEACPPGAVETMERLGLRLGEKPMATFSGPPGLVTVREGQTDKFILRDDYGMLKVGTLLTGKFFIGPERVYVRFTEAHPPEGGTFPVCLEALSLKGGRGLIADLNGGEDTATVSKVMYVKPVTHFD